MSTPLSILCVAVISAVLVALFEKQQPAFALFVSAAASLVLLAKAGGAVQNVLAGLARLEQSQAATPTDVFCAAQASCC